MTWCLWLSTSCATLSAVLVISWWQRQSDTETPTQEAMCYSVQPFLLLKLSVSLRQPVVRPVQGVSEASCFSPELDGMHGYSTLQHLRYPSKVWKLTSVMDYRMVQYPWLLMRLKTKMTWLRDTYSGGWHVQTFLLCMHTVMLLLSLLTSPTQWHVLPLSLLSISLGSDITAWVRKMLFWIWIRWVIYSVLAGLTIFFYTFYTSGI